MRRWLPVAAFLAVFPALGTAAGEDPPKPAPAPAPEPPKPPAPPEPDVAYVGPDEVEARLKALAAAPSQWKPKLETYGKSASGRPLWLLRIGRPDVPLVLVHGGLGARDAAGTAAALDFAARFPQRVEEALAAKVGYLVIPAPNPDALAAFLAGKGWGRGGGAVDRDQDGRKGEDGPDDLDGDGEVLTMRRKSPSGTWSIDDAPAKDGKRTGDPRLMKDAGQDARRDVSYEVLDEGKDDDGDGEVNEDPPGTDLTRNLVGVWEEPGAWPGDGPFPGSSPETKALLDLTYEETRLVAWYAFVSEGPRLERASERGKDADQDDALYVLLGEAWKKASGVEVKKASERPGSDKHPASELDWAARHLGIVAVRVPVWRIPKEEGSARERPEADELDWLLWNDRVLGGKGFVPWHEVKHPQWGSVEVGGWKRFTRLEPPPDQLAAAVRRVSGLPLVHADFAPRLDVLVETKDLGGSTWRVTLRAANRGGAPTDTKLGETAARSMGVRLTFEPAAGTEVLGGPRAAVVGTLAAGGVSSEGVWLVRRAGTGVLGNAKAFHRVAGTATKEVTVP